MWLINWLNGVCIHFHITSLALLKSSDISPYYKIFYFSNSVILSILKSPKDECIYYNLIWLCGCFLFNLASSELILDFNVTGPFICSCIFSRYGKGIVCIILFFFFLYICPSNLRDPKQLKSFIAYYSTLLLAGPRRHKIHQSLWSPAEIFNS